MTTRTKLLSVLTVVVALGAGLYLTSNWSDLQGRVSGTALPDLAVTDVTMDAITGIPSVTSANVGKASVADSTAGATTFYIDGTAIQSYNWTTMGDRNFLTKGGQTTGTFSNVAFATLSAGDHELKACIDSSSLVTEKSEANNCATETVALLPDLTYDLDASSYTISGEIVMSSDGKMILQGIQLFNLTTDYQCGIENVGLASAEGNSYNGCSFYNGSDTVGNISLSAIDELDGQLSLAPGSTKTFTESKTYSNPNLNPYSPDVGLVGIIEELYSTGTAELTVNYAIDTAINSRVITESDETNNTPTGTITLDDSNITWVIR